MSQPFEADRPADRAAAAAYIASMLEHMSPLAQRHGLDVVAYLLDMAHLELASVMPPGSPVGRSR
jgi:hypothetical protein